MMSVIFMAWGMPFIMPMPPFAESAGLSLSCANIHRW
jgi:hypothetical protein